MYRNSRSPLHHDLPTGHIDSCQVCGHKDLRLVLDLGHHPPCDSLLWPDNLQEVERVYPLRFHVCGNCSLSQIDYVIPPEELFFADYPYRSGITQTLVDKLTQTAVSTLENFHVKEGSLVIDIGSNDGTVLQGFKSRGMRVLGVEPTKIAKIANDSGIETKQAFFTEGLADEILKTHGPASVVTATNVFAHVSNLGEVMRGVCKLLPEGGIFCTESHYLVDLLDTVQYDSIYHEHLRYYTVKSIIRLFDYYDFTVTHVERIENYGGSIRVFAVKGRNLPVSSSVNDLLRLEEEKGIYGKRPYLRFTNKVHKVRLELLSFIVTLNAEGKTVIGIGCPGRASTLLNYAGLNSDLMPYIAEQSSSLKLGLFLPGKHIPIVDEKRMFAEQPDFAVMLSWHYAEPIVKKLREKGLKSKIVLPLPTVRVLDT